MKLLEITRDWRVDLGLALILIGVANWMVGRIRTREYSVIVAEQPIKPADQSYRSFDELDPNGDADDVLAPFSDAQQRAYYATARMDFYHATFMTGYFLVIIGLIVTFFGFRSLIHHDASRASRHLNIRALGQGPPTV